MSESELSRPEFSRIVECARLGDGVRHIAADADERAALARRFGLVAIHRLEAEIALHAESRAVAADGRMTAEIVQSCAVSGEDLPMAISEPVHFRFVPAGEHRPDEEIELSEEDCDDIEFTGASFDLGEAVAQSLALAIDPFATGPDAETARRDSGVFGEEAGGPFAALAALKKT